MPWLAGGGAMTFCTLLYQDDSQILALIRMFVAWYENIVSLQMQSGSVLGGLLYRRYGNLFQVMLLLATPRVYLVESQKHAKSFIFSFA